jgi:hypothetical protein
MLILIFISFRPFSDFTFEGFFFFLLERHVYVYSLYRDILRYLQFALLLNSQLSLYMNYLLAKFRVLLCIASWPIFKRIKIIERMHSFYYA